MCNCEHCECEHAPVLVGLCSYCYLVHVDNDQEVITVARNIIDILESLLRDRYPALQFMASTTDSGTLFDGELYENSEQLISDEILELITDALGRR